MKRLAYLLPTLCLGFGLTGCPDDTPGTDVTDTDPDDDDGTSTGGPSTVTLTTTTDPPTTTEPPTTTDPPTTTEPGSTTMPEECTEADECIVDEDCPLPGATCTACFCTGGAGCKEYGPGAFGNCGEEGIAACEGATGAACFAPNDITSVCVSTCKEACDCPQPPAGFEGQVSCEDAFTLEGNECIITCTSDDECPDDWSCYSGAFCVHGTLPPLPGWGDCANEVGSCPATDSGGAGFCLQLPEAMDASTGVGGVCSAQPCEDADDCADAPATGTAAPACMNLTMGMDMDCYLDCSGGATCPDDMICHPEIEVCYWETIFRPAYGECLESEGFCPDGPTGGAQNCLFDTMETFSWCTNSCVDVDDCPAEPSGTGDAPVACTAIGMLGDYCVLDCSAGQTCPDNMDCQGGLCVNLTP